MLSLKVHYINVFKIMNHYFTQDSNLRFPNILFHKIIKQLNNNDPNT